jgi:hypothetical protein
MTTIPLDKALKFINNAEDIYVVGDYDGVTDTSYSFSDDEEEFLQVTVSDQQDETYHEFLKADNLEVQVHGDLMTLNANTDAGPAPVQIQLLTGMRLEPITPSKEVHEQQCKLENHLTRILELCRDGRECGLFDGGIDAIQQPRAAYTGWIKR